MSNQRRRIGLTLAVVCLAATRAVTAGSQCPNLSGTYLIQGEDGQVQISIEQYKCGRIEIVRDSGYDGEVTPEKHVLKLDGKDQADTPWLGAGGLPSTSARFVGSELLVEVRIAGRG